MKNSRYGDPQKDFDTINVEVQGLLGLVNMSLFPDQYLRWHVCNKYKLDFNYKIKILHV